MGKQYYLGLDMGTSSVGWAVTDPEYKLLRAKGKDLWGVRLFSAAKTAAERRTFKVSRRRLQREKARIGIVKEIFSEAISDIDPGFYQRLDDSKYFPEDKTEEQPFALFAGPQFTDKEYYKKYPTIFHLRSELAHSKEPHDVRLVYLAVLNIFKHRGHFLNDNLSEDSEGDLHLLFEQLSEAFEAFPSTYDQTKIEEILSSRKISNSVRRERLSEELGIRKRTPEYEAVSMICGLKGTIIKLFPEEELEEENKKLAVSFRDSNYEQSEADMMSALSEEAFDIVGILKQIHDWGLLANIMQGEQFISDARIKTYNKHKSDLLVLKRVYKTCADRAKYDEMFRIMADNNYSAYVGSVNSDSSAGPIRRGASCRPDDFFKRIKNELSAMQKAHGENEDITYILKEIENDTFLPKQLTSANGVIPNQAHLKELKSILANAEGYLPFLSESDESGLTNRQKLEALLSFHIPYYIGPLYKGNNNAWVVRKESGQVLPWNFDEKIDSAATSEAFISRMVRECTYLRGENVLPKGSLLYEKFMVLNELNNVKVNGTPISIELKQSIYRDLFQKKKKVSGKDLKSYLKMTGVVGKKDPVEITGIDGDFKAALTSYHRFQEILGAESLDKSQEEMAEQIVFWATVYGDSRKFLHEKIEKAYGEKLTEAQIKRAGSLKYRDWGRLSREFLYFEGADRATGEIQPLISRMWNENLNLMECLSERFTYREDIEKFGSGLNKSFYELQHDDLDEMYLSPPVKRMVWQTILIVRELVDVLGCPPEKIFVEMARDPEGKNEKTRKASRKSKFADLYRKCKEEGRDWSKEIENTDEARFRSKKLYLYYTQKGRCMYTGEPIALEDLFNDNLYDIDHIYPRHYVKDDSIEKNLVLVKKQINNRKSDTFPIEQAIRKEMYAWWASLLEGGFITKEKYERLMRSTPFTPEEQAAFISRQLVETRQGTKAVTQLFEQVFPKSKVVYSKASNVSDFRHQFDLLKCREVNNFHHANDAYLNIVVGNVYHVKFTSNPINYVREYLKDRKKYEYHMEKLFDYPVVRGGEAAWETKGGKSISVVRRMMAKNTPLVTRMNYEEHGGLADQQIRSADEAKKVKGVGYLPIKASDERLTDTTKYGGFVKYSGAYFFLVEHTVKGKRVRSIEPVPLYKKDVLGDKERLAEYCKKYLGYIEPDVRMKEIKLYSLLNINGFFAYLTGRTGAQLVIANAVELKVDYRWQKYIRRLFNSSIPAGEDLKNEVTKDLNLELYDYIKEKHLSGIYGKRPNPLGEKLDKGRSLFKELKVEDQISILRQLIQISSGAIRSADLRMLGESSHTGVALINKNISVFTQVELINESVTGLYKSSADLLRV